MGMMTKFKMTQFEVVLEEGNLWRKLEDIIRVFIRRLYSLLLSKVWHLLYFPRFTRLNKFEFDVAGPFVALV